MELTRFSIDKVRWLVRTSAFRKQPVKILKRVLQWELIRWNNAPVQFRFDRSLVLQLYPNDGAARLTYYFEYHEPEIFRFLDCYLRSGMTFVDVGANIGCYTLFAAKRVGPLGQVWAFEPQQPTYSRLVENIQNNRLS